MSGDDLFFKKLAGQFGFDVHPIGIHLGFTLKEIETMKQNNQHNSLLWGIGLLNEWKGNLPRGTTPADKWKQLAKAMEEAKRNDLADMVDEHAKGDVAPPQVQEEAQPHLPVPMAEGDTQDGNMENQTGKAGTAIHIPNEDDRPKVVAGARPTNVAGKSRLVSEETCVQQATSSNP
ncbi:unnamed protein product [Owenia fusiformis]|uniref:Uncharacterized protein n=1 Tax=Owenia fusiformis TaxID=6347 RepID=A0A8J1UXV5_OWEFU|nr:unnamed protein product [Owenia fusiformis]